MTNPAPEMDLDAFRDEGYLQEVNRQFLHPLGLALYVEFDDDGHRLGCLDGRDDPEGVTFSGNGPSLAIHAASIAAKVQERIEARKQALGFWIQPPFN
jgi:hypothetical protein